MKSPTIALPEAYEWRSTSHFGYFMSWEIWCRGSDRDGMWIERKTGSVCVRGNPQPREQLESALRACNAEAEAL